MLDSDELRLLSRWCRARRLHWQPGVADDGQPAVLLTGATPGMVWRGMLLLPTDDEWRLLDAPGDMLAAASDLPALLDALDAGVAAPDAAPGDPYTESGGVASSVAGGSGEIIRNRLGSAIM
ncbi:MAG: hypothetical protein J0H91_07850 [Rhodospirillales bacterium]|nr:hypothetical protein [Rhodospirillales bacterium]